MRTVTASDYLDLVHVSDPQLSPDGEAVVFVRKIPKSNREYESTVYLVPTDGGEPRRFTSAAGVDTEPRWSPDGSQLAFVSTRGEDDKPQLWVMPTDGGEAKRVTNVAGEVSDIAWSQNGRTVAFLQRVNPNQRNAGADVDLGSADYVAEDPDPRIVDRMFYRVEGEYFDGGYLHVYVSDLEAGTVEAVTEGPYDHFTPTWDDAGILYYLGKRTGTPDDNIIHDVLAYDPESDEEERLTRTASWPELGLAVTGDGRLAYTSTPEVQASLYQINLEIFDRETAETTVPTAMLDRSLDRAGSITWGPAGEYVYFVTPDEGDFVIWRVPGDASTPPESVTSTGHVTDISVGDNAIAFVRSEWDHPGDLFLASLDVDSTPQRITRINEDILADRAVSRPEEVRFVNNDTVIQGWMLKPPDFNSNDTYPLVVEIHGGPQAMWSTSGTMWHEFQTLAAQGYVVFWCNPRGSRGYGQEFLGGIERDWGGVIYQDIMAGIDQVTTRKYIDADNIFVTGGSFGGYMTVWAIGHSDRFTAAVAQRAPSDLTSCYGSSRVFKLMEWDHNSLPWQDHEFWWSHSPIAYADVISTPTLILHSEGDFNVPAANGELLFTALKKNRVDTRMVRYPREGHELSREGEPAHVVDRIKRIARWFEGYSDHHDAPPVLADTERR